MGTLTLYSDHLEQARLLYAPRPALKMTRNPEVKDLFDFTFEDFTLSEYDPHPHIKAR